MLSSIWAALPILRFQLGFVESSDLRVCVLRLLRVDSVYVLRLLRAAVLHFH